MTTVEISERVTRLFTDGMSIEVPSPDTDLIEEGLLDSLTLVDLLLQMETQFEVTISLDDLEIDNFRSVSSITRYLGERLAAR